PPLGKLVELSRRSQYAVVPWQVGLRQCRHNAAGARIGDLQHQGFTEQDNAGLKRTRRREVDDKKTIAATDARRVFRRLSRRAFCGFMRCETRPTRRTASKAIAGQYTSRDKTMRKG